MFYLDEIVRLIDLLIVECIEWFLRRFRLVLMMVFVVMLEEWILIFSIQFWLDLIWFSLLIPFL